MFDMPSKKHKIKVIQLLSIFLITDNIIALVNSDKTIRPGSDAKLFMSRT